MASDVTGRQVGDCAKCGSPAFVDVSDISVNSVLWKLMWEGEKSNGAKAGGYVFRTCCTNCRSPLDIFYDCYDDAGNLRSGDSFERQAALQLMQSEQEAKQQRLEHDLLFRSGKDLIFPYMHLDGVEPKNADCENAQQEIQLGIEKLRLALKIHPQNWSAYWIVGKGYQALGDSENAYESFKASWGIHKKNVDVAREYMIECLNLGRGTEGVMVAEQALKLEPQNPGVIANYALALLINGQLDSAELHVNRSLEIESSDEATQYLRNIIDEVKRGKRRRPTKLCELQEGATE